VPHDWIISYNLQTKSENVFLDIPGGTLYHPFFSWDDRWVLFKEPVAATTRSKIMIAPVRYGRAGNEQQWVTVTDGRYADDKPQFAPDGNTVYFTSTHDGYLCIWAQKLDPQSKHPLGAPTPYEHFHNSSGAEAALVSSDLTVAQHLMMINLPNIRRDVWLMQIE
jgi:hypothetical protein